MKKIIPVLLILFFVGGILQSCGNKATNEGNFTEINEFSVEPDSSTLYGNIKIAIKSVYFPASITSVVVKIASKKMYGIKLEPGQITGYVPGNDNPGKFSIEISTNKGNFLLKDAFEYKPLEYPLFKKMAAMGASYTHGFISMGLDWELQLHSPFAYVAKQAGAYFPQALLRKGILPPQPQKM